MSSSSPRADSLAAGFYGRDLATPATDLDSAGLVPTAADLARAEQTVRAHAAPTPAFLARRLSVELGRQVWVKHESASDIRSFKHRGALYAVHAAHERGATAVVTASTGNHGQGVALAGRALGMPVTVFTPPRIDEVKRVQMRDLGADVRVGGPTLTDAEAASREFAAATGAYYVEDGENPELMAGAATVGTEILAQVPGVDVIVAPVGGGNLAAGICLAVANAGAGTRVVGAQSTAACGVTASWLAGDMRARPCDTLAGGLATEHPGALSLKVLSRHLHAMCLVEEEWLWEGIRSVYDRLGVALELAGVAPFAALQRFGERIAGDRAVLVASGACIDRQQLAAALSGEPLEAWRQRHATDA